MSSSRSDTTTGRKITARQGVLVALLALTVACQGDGDPNERVDTDAPDEPVIGTTTGDALLTLTIQEPAGVDRPALSLRTGVPFPEGLVAADAALGLIVDDALVPAQTRVMSVWEDGTARWVLFDATVPVAADASVALQVVPLAEPPQIADALDVQVAGDTITVDTGPLRVEIPTGDGRVLGQVWLNGTAMLDDTAPVGPYVRSQGRTYLASNLMDDSSPDPDDPVAKADPARTLVAPWPLSVSVEESGPVHAVIRVSGGHLNEDGASFSTFITRLHFTRGATQVRVDHTLVYTGASGEGVDSYGFYLPLAGSGATVEGVLATSVQHLEANSHLVDGAARAGHAMGTATQNIADNHAVVVLRDMAELFPKGLAVSPQGIDVQLYPEQAGTWSLERYSNSVDRRNGETGTERNRGAQGLARTDTFLLQLGSGSQDATNVAELGAALDAGPVLAMPTPQWISDARVMGVGPFTFPVDPSSPAHYRVDRYLQVVADFMRVNQRSQYDWYGMENYGDIRGLFDGGDASFTWSEVGRYGWSGNSGEPSNQLWLQYLRKPSQTVLLDAEALARHTQDLQMIHYGDADRTDASNWNGRNRSSAVGSLHRHGRQAFSGYGGQPEYSHVAGVETWYYLSGDLRAKDALFEAAAFIEQYGESRPDWTALVNGIDVLSRAEAVFWDSPHGARFAARDDVLLQYVDDNNEVDALLDETRALPFGLFVRGTPGLAYHHERTGDARAGAAVIAAADRLVDGSDPYGLWGDGQNGGEFFHMLPLAYAAQIASDPAPYQALANEVLALNCHVERSADAGAISDASLQTIPDDWRAWTWQWEEDPLTQGSPGILWIDRQLTYRNNFMQDYHSYRMFMHLGAVAAAVPPGATTCER